MSYLVVVPELVAAAATDLANIGSSISAANAAAAAPTTALVAAGGDEVSAAIAALFGAHARAYQALSAQAAMFHEQFVRASPPAVTPTPSLRRQPRNRFSKICST